MKGLILLDWDGTVVDEQNQIHDVHMLQRTVADKTRRDWMVGLSSDTPLKRLQKWGESLGINGPIIAERGAVVWWPNQQPLLARSAEDFSVFRNLLLVELMRQGMFALFFGDSVEFLKTAGWAIAEEAVVAVDAYRVCSVGLLIRRIVNQMLVCDSSLAQRLLELLASVEPMNTSDCTLDLNNRTCFIHIGDPKISKRTGLEVLFDRWGRPSTVYIIGDSMADYVNLPGVHQLAVGNADPDYKALAECQAIGAFSRGCVELMSGID